jgi:ribosomal protein S1
MKVLDEKEKVFDVKIIELVRGGYLALYKDMVKVFLPGSHASANVVSNFEDMIGKTIPVIIDNYDKSSNLYVVSYKKYIRKTLPEKIKELSFSKKYKGILTSKPTDYGLFIELDGFFTGLVHKSEIKNYDSIKKTFKVGQEIEFYIKNIIKKDSQYRIMMTLDESNIDSGKAQWQKLKDDIEGEVLDFFYDNESNNLNIIKKDGEHVSIKTDHESIIDKIYNANKIKIVKIDVLKENIYFDFIKV